MANQRALKQILTKELNPYLFPKNDFIAGNAMFDNQGSDSDVVIVNESQELPAVIENQTVFPLPINSTEHANKSYTIDTHRTEATYVEDVDELLTNFSVRSNELQKHGNVQKTQYFDKIAYLWAQDGVAGMQRTTGSTSTLCLNGTMTGSRKQMTRGDIIKLISTHAKNEVPTEGLVMLIDEAMYWDMINTAGFTQYDLTGVVDPVRGGTLIGDILGVKIYKRNGVPFYSSDALTKLSYIDTDGSRHRPDGAECLSVMMWHPAFVRYSLGNEQVYVNVDDAQYQGSYMSTKLRVGATRSRLDDIGVEMLVQEA
jgi:hypothetical protein